VTVDGRQPGAAGMCIGPLAELMFGLGANDAVNLDGGGSTTMVVNGQVVNTPSDSLSNGGPGRERTVANHLGVMFTPGGPAPHCPDYVAAECNGDADRQACDGTSITQCEGGTPTAFGDCGAFGAGCSIQGGEAHCVHPYCLINLDGAEDGAFCQDEAWIGTCELGQYSEGDCSFFGATCSEQGGSGHCVHPYCPLNLDGGEDGTFCLDDGIKLGRCELGQYEEIDCASLSTTCGATPAGPACLGEASGEGTANPPAAEEPAPEPGPGPQEDPAPEPEPEPDDVPGDEPAGDEGRGGARAAPPSSAAACRCASADGMPDAAHAALILEALALMVRRRRTDIAVERH